MARSETQITFRLPRKLAQRLERVARGRGQKRSEVLREAARVYIDGAEGLVTDRPFERVVHLIGSVHSGIDDLGSGHRDHLRRILGESAARGR